MYAISEVWYSTPTCKREEKDCEERVKVRPIFVNHLSCLWDSNDASVADFASQASDWRILLAGAENLDARVTYTVNRYLSSIVIAFRYVCYSCFYL